MYHDMTWFPQIMTYLFQGLFKDFWGIFSRTFQGLFFVLSNIHSWKNYQQWTFYKVIQWPLDLEFAWKIGGRFVYVFLTFLHDLLYYGNNTASNNSAWRGYGGPPQKIFIRISTKPCNSGGYTSLVIMPQKETANFEIDWYIETYNIHKYM